MKILICGAKGLLGNDCTNVLRDSYDVISLNSNELDITDPINVMREIKYFDPEVIINCAAYTRVDDCEKNREKARMINTFGAKNLALCTQNFGSKLIHISTDYVFDGRKSLPESYSEEDVPNPLCYYGQTKFEGEMMVSNFSKNYLIVRTSWMFGLNGSNFLKTMLRLAIKSPEKAIKVVNDQFGSPTWSKRLAIQINKLIDTNKKGIYHATSEGFCSWYEMAKLFLQTMRLPFNIIPCTTEEYLTRAKRPKNSILENRKLKEEGINLMQDWKIDLKEFVYGFREILINEISK